MTQPGRVPVTVSSFLCRPDKSRGLCQALVRRRAFGDDRVATHERPLVRAEAAWMFDN